MQVARVLDCKGLTCPEPILNIRLAINELKPGEIVEMQATDPGSIADMDSWSKRTGNQIVEQRQEDDVYIFYVEKKNG